MSSCMNLMLGLSVICWNHETTLEVLFQRLSLMFLLLDVEMFCAILGVVEYESLTASQNPVDEVSGIDLVW